MHVAAVRVEYQRAAVDQYGRILTAGRQGDDDGAVTITRCHRCITDCWPTDATMINSRRPRPHGGAA